MGRPEGNDAPREGRRKKAGHYAMKQAGSDGIRF